MRASFVLGCILVFLQPCFADLRAGVAAVDITPPPGTPLGGYGARLGKPMEGVHDRIFAKALVLDDGRERVAIVTTDLIGSDAAMQRAISEAARLKRENVMLCASHTHSGPGALASNAFVAAMGKFDQQFYDWMRERLIETVKKAGAALVPAKLAVGVGELTGRSRNRRKDDTVIDPQLSVIRVDRANGEPLAVLVNFSAHGTVLPSNNMLVSGDWMGVMQRSLEKSIGRGAIAMYANGAEGDQSPLPPSGLDPFERCEAQGHAVAEAARTVYDLLRPQSRIRLRTIGEELELPKTTKSQLLGKEKTWLQIIALTPDPSPAGGRGENKTHTPPSPAGGRSTGRSAGPGGEGATLLALPGEVIAPLGLDIKERVKKLGCMNPIAMGLANDHLGYILTEEEFAQGGYEVQVSFYGDKFGAQLADAMVALAGRMLKAK